MGLMFASLNECMHQPSSGMLIVSEYVPTRLDCIAYHIKSLLCGGFQNKALQYKTRVLKCFASNVSILLE